MKIKVLLLVAAILIPCTANAQPTMGVYFDLEASRMICNPQEFTVFDAYIYICDANYLISAVEYQLITPEDPGYYYFQVYNVTYPDQHKVSIGWPFEGHSIAYWPPLDGISQRCNILCTISCFTTEPCFSAGTPMWEYPLLIGPHPESGELRGTYAPDHELFSITGLASYLCIYDWIPPALTGAEVISSYRVDATFSEWVTAETAEDASNYLIYEKENPSDTIWIVDAEFIDEGQKDVALTLEEPLSEYVVYVLEANNISDFAGNIIEQNSWREFGILPNLVVSELEYYPYPVLSGCSPLDVEFVVVNDGDVPCDSFSVLAMWIINDGDTAIGYDLATYSYEGLGVGETISESLSLTIPPEAYISNYIKVIADYLEEVPELYENNTKQRSFSVSGPRIVSISDVEGDNGCMVSILFKRAWDDRESAIPPTLRYEVFRRVDSIPGVPAAGFRSGQDQSMDESDRPLEPRLDERHPTDAVAGSFFCLEGAAADWEYMGQIEATYQEEYTIDVPTIADSTEEYGMYWSVFKVCAVQEGLTPPDIYYLCCCPDSGYSVDNLGPIATLLQSFAASYRESAIEVKWRLVEAGDRLEFFILRAEDGNSGFEEMESFHIEREGLEFSYLDTGVEWGRSYRYRVGYLEEGQRHNLFDTEWLNTPELPLTLYQNYPNPFNPVTTISYYLPDAARVTLNIYDVSGHRIACLVDEYQEKGRHYIQWNGEDSSGIPVSSGVYFYRMQADKETITRKMALLR